MADDYSAERAWYNSEEGPLVSDGSKKRFPKFRSAQNPAALNLTASARLQRQLDADKWESQLLSQSGVLPARGPAARDGDESESRVCLQVNAALPPFLTNLDATKFHVTSHDPRFTTDGDLAQLARNGSQAVSEWKKHHEQQHEMQRMARGERGRPAAECRTSGSSHYRDALSATGHVNRTALPVWGRRADIVRMVAENSVLIVVGETGSGKTTQVTQFLHEEGYSRFGQIACTQPRRVAAVSVARRVADEMRVRLGDEVGYTIRFEDVSSAKTVIRYMTDGILLRESLADRLLSRYAVVIMDEAHERALNTDVLFGILRGVLARRSDLRVLVTSATMDSAKFARFFGNCPVLNVSGRTFAVDVSFMRSNPQDHVQAAVAAALKVHLTEDPGDILVFMTGQDDVECTCDLVRRRVEEVDGAPPLEVLPIYSQLPADLQARVFEVLPVRKCVVATNIAETSLTIPGIRYVIDSGFVKQKNYSARAGIDTLLVRPISQAAAVQRAGRAGRTADGKCWRLYTELAFATEMPAMTVPEVQRTNLANIILLLKSLGFNDVLSFGFMDRPPLDNFKHALAQLWSLRAVAADGTLTPLGLKMVFFPLDPSLSKMMLVGADFGCLDEIVSIVSMLSVPPVFIKPKGREEEAEARREKFIVPESDHLTLLNVYRLWERAGRRGGDGERARWARENFLNNVSLVKASEVRGQLTALAGQAGLQMASAGDDWAIVRKAVCSAYFHHTAQLKGLSEYVNLHTSVPCVLHPSSALAGCGFVPEFIVYHELMLTTKHFIHGVTAVDPLWLSQMAPEFFTATDIYGNPIPEGRPPDAGEGHTGGQGIATEEAVAVPDAPTVDDELRFTGESVVLPTAARPPKKRRRLGKS
jgi:pre-mRNA-splicing factor ATP-dependent RNA helicase DHX38/PRP16